MYSINTLSHKEVIKKPEVSKNKLKTIVFRHENETTKLNISSIFLCLALSKILELMDFQNDER